MHVIDRWLLSVFRPMIAINPVPSHLGVPVSMCVGFLLDWLRRCMYLRNGD